MPFCTKCGHKLREGNAFCGECGAPVPLVNLAEDDLEDEEELEAEFEPESGFELEDEDEPEIDDAVESDGSEKRPTASPRKAPRESRVKHCPACGEIVSLNDFVCSSCGHELRRVTEGSIKDLYRRLDEIESSRPERTNRDPGGDSATDQKLASAIRNFPIPNTKEDLVEFLVMANGNSCWDDKDAEDKAVPGAWRSKFDQAYSKAELLFGQDASFDRFRKIKAQSVDAEKVGARKKIIYWLGLAAFLFASFGALMLMPTFLSCGMESENMRLQGVLSQVYEYIDEGEYGLARKEAAGLVYSKSTSTSDTSESADHWEEIRKETLELIAQKERGE